MTRRVWPVAGVLLAGPAAAYSLVSWNWAWMDHPLALPFDLDVASFAPVGPAGQVEAALRDALATWGREGGSTFDYTGGARTTSDSWAADRRLVTWMDPGGTAGATLAVSQSWGWGGEMTDCDQRFYLSNAFGPITWSADPAGAAPGTYDLQYNAVHEYGHCAGINHSSDPDAIMYASTPGGEQPADRHLRADDVAALQAIYGAPSGVDLVLSIDGPVVAGASHEFIISGGEPGERAWLLATTRGAGRTC
ncbi:MAG TPA: matrixin family metalloprotease, partial [Myxococcota bacterium]|nr:matrixin family metalloprotease [Myxococcota bacterium]